MALENNLIPSVVATTLVKSYPHGQAGMIKVLNELDLTLYQGEQVAITGASGSGKSTLLQILAGLERTDSGSVQLLQQSMHQMKDQDLARFRNHHLGFVYQFHHLIDDFTALENVALPARIKGLATTTANDQALAILAQMGLADRLTHFPWQLSGGERQRCAIARALINQPEIIFADEPTGNLDQESARQVSELMMSLCRSNGATLILVTHNPHLAGQADRQLTLTGGVLQ
jgi:lipoprotein-releasing system ATP-binding protein